MTFSLKNIIRVAVLTQDSKKWPTYDGKSLTRWQYLTASEATRCVRELSFNKTVEAATQPVENFWDNMSDDEFQRRLDEMSDDDVRGIFERGNTIEDWIVSRLLEVQGPGEEYMFLGDDQRSFYSDKHRISGTPDGLHLDYNRMEYRTLEFKSSQNPISAAKDAHISQVQINASLIYGLSDALSEIYDIPLSGMTCAGTNILYVNSDNFLTMNEYEIPFDGRHVRFKEAAAKAKALFGTTPSGELLPVPPETLKPEGLEKNGCYFCAFKRQCAGIEEHRGNAERRARLENIIARAEGNRKLPEMPKFASDADRKVIVRAIIDYADYRAAGKDAEAHMDALKPALKEFALRHKNAKVKFSEDGHNVSVSVSTSNRAGGIDKDKLAAFLIEHGAELSDFEKPGTTSEALYVTVKPDVTGV